MNYKDYQHYKQARDAVWKVLIDCNIRDLPVSLNEICKHLGIRIFSYAKAAGLIQTMQLQMVTSKTDGLSFYSGDIPVILFNEKLPAGRKRFTVGHEIGHIVLQHIKPGQVTIINRDPDPEDNSIETAANQFAARILAPACVLWALGIHSADDISKICNISKQAAEFRANRMEILYKRDKFLISPLERQVYVQFQDFINHHL